MDSKKEDFNDNDFDWIKVRRENYETVPVSQTEKFVKKLKENPFVPVGAILTTMFLSYGLWSYRQGKPKTSQLMMRGRVAAQGFTIFALVIGIGMGLHSK